MNDNFSKFGRSGCTFYLDDSGIILRKISSDSEYNDRLYSQYLKQSKFEDSNNFSTPTPYQFHKLNKLHHFDNAYYHIGWSSCIIIFIPLIIPTCLKVQNLVFL